jgi:hypothetical protein
VTYVRNRPYSVPYSLRYSVRYSVIEIASKGIAKSEIQFGDCLNLWAEASKLIAFWELIAAESSEY